ncbi:hypothetical protein ACJJTC_015888 [Scirpophaga incertulas]
MPTKLCSIATLRARTALSLLGYCLPRVLANLAAPPGSVNRSTDLRIRITSDTGSEPIALLHGFNDYPPVKTLPSTVYPPPSSLPLPLPIVVKRKLPTSSYSDDNPFPELLVDTDTPSVLSISIKGKVNVQKKAYQPPPLSLPLSPEPTLAPTPVTSTNMGFHTPHSSSSDKKFA